MGRTVSNCHPCHWSGSDAPAPLPLTLYRTPQKSSPALLLLVFQLANRQIQLFTSVFVLVLLVLSRGIATALCWSCPSSFHLFVPRSCLFRGSFGRSSTRELVDYPQQQKSTARSLGPLNTAYIPRLTGSQPNSLCGLAQNAISREEPHRIQAQGLPARPNGGCPVWLRSALLCQ